MCSLLRMFSTLVGLPVETIHLLGFLWYDTREKEITAFQNYPYFLLL